MKELSPGTRVRTHRKLVSASPAFFVAKHHFHARRANEIGTIAGPVPGQSDVYWVRHDGDPFPYWDGSTLAVYGRYEFDVEVNEIPPENLSAAVD